MNGKNKIQNMIGFDLTQHDALYCFSPTMIIKHKNTFCRIILNEFSQQWEQETCRGVKCDIRGTMKE